MKFRDCKSGEKVIMVPVDGEDGEAWKLAKAFNELVEVVEEYRGGIITKARMLSDDRD